jgi:ribosomal protein S1
MSTPELPLEQFPLHTIVKGLVQHVTEAGVIVRISPTVTGYIPRRELTWEETEEPLRLVRAGQQISAMVTGEDALSGHVILSPRLAL